MARDYSHYDFLNEYDVLSREEEKDLFKFLGENSFSVSFKTYPGSSIVKVPLGVGFYGFPEGALEIEDAVSRLRGLGDFKSLESVAVLGEGKRDHILFHKNGGLFETRKNNGHFRKVVYYTAEGLEVRNKLICSNLKSIRYVLDRMITRRNKFYGDFFQEGVLVLGRAVYDFDYKKGNVFISYISRSLKNMVLSFDWNIFDRRRESACNLEKEVYFDDIQGRECDGFRMVDTAIDSERILSFFHGREREVILFRMEGKSHKDIGKKMGLSRTMIQKIEEGAIERVRRKMRLKEAS